MDAAQLKKVTSNLNLGTNALPASGPSDCLPHGTAGAGPTPTAAPNSGRKLDSSSLLAASHSISNGQGRQYDGSADNDEDDTPLKTAGNGSTGGDFRPSANTSRL